MKRGAGSGRDEELRQGTARFAEWRRTRQPGMPIPVELWVLAVELARRHGVRATEVEESRYLGRRFAAAPRRFALG
jgi:hypothetical protein